MFYTSPSLQDQAIGDPTKIDSVNLEKLKARMGEDVKAQCRLREMASYGFDGFSEGLSTKNHVCPSIGGNCCGEAD